MMMMFRTFTITTKKSKYLLIPKVLLLWNNKLLWYKSILWTTFFMVYVNYQKRSGFFAYQNDSFLCFTAFREKIKPSNKNRLSNILRDAKYAYFTCKADYYFSENEGTRKKQALSIKSTE